MSPTTCAFGALLAAAMLVTTPLLAQPTNDKPEDYPAGEGRDDTFYACTACHGFKLVAQQGQTRRQWDDTLDWMTQRHNMPRPRDPDRKIILDYLEAAFPPRTAPRGWQNPFQQR